MLALVRVTGGGAGLSREPAGRGCCRHLHRTSNSVKSAQYLAALRAYYMLECRLSTPTLFRAGADASARLVCRYQRRAMTVEWVDWLYALAFSKWPEAPMRTRRLGPDCWHCWNPKTWPHPNCQVQSDYLERNQRGWLLRFRNTDDAFIYQPEWINNAYYQASIILISSKQSSTIL